MTAVVVVHVDESTIQMNEPVLVLALDETYDMHEEHPAYGKGEADTNPVFVHVVGKAG